MNSKDRDQVFCPQMDESCIEENCAWFDQLNKTCAVNVIATSLANLFVLAKLGAQRPEASKLVVAKGNPLGH